MASGDTLLVFPAQTATLPASRYATFDVIASADTPVGNHVVLDFDDAAANTEFADFVGVMPGQYDGTSALEVLLHWSSEATSGNVKWDVAFKRIADDVDDLDTVTFAAIQSSTDATASAAGEVAYTVVDFTNAQADGIQPNELFVLRIERDSADAADTLTSQDAELHAIELRLD